MMMWWNGYGGGGMLLLLVGTALGVAVIALLALALIRRSDPRAKGQRSPRSGPGVPTTLELLSQRYARGEIDTATFDRMRARLEGSGT